MKKSRLARKILGGSLLIAGTTVGAGMLGIPLLTARAGFLPAALITIIAWGIMLWTGLLFMEVSLWMPEGSNLLSMTRRFFGEKGRWFSGAMFLFLYYCLLVAYFAAGAPLFASGVQALLGLSLTPFWGYISFGVIFGLLVWFGAKWIDRVNILLTAGLVFTFVCVMGIGGPEVDGEKLILADWGASVFALPILFSAFGYHNMIPPLATYFKKDGKALRASIWIGTAIPLAIYLIWQWLVMGLIPIEEIEKTLSAGLPVTAALSAKTGGQLLYTFGQSFAFFAIITSFLGVSFSFVDFLADGMKAKRTGWPRAGLCALTFLPPIVFVMAHPKIFDRALSVAGGIGEAILNGLIPIGLVWVGRYAHNLNVKGWKGSSSRLGLTVAALATLAVLVLEIYELAT